MRADAWECVSAAFVLLAFALAFATGAAVLTAFGAACLTVFFAAVRAGAFTSAAASAARRIRVRGNRRGALGDAELGAAAG